MKKILTFIIAIIFSISVKAQCPITEAIDFTATDCHGEEIHLFDILDGGQYVLIDFFFTTCGPCQSATPSVVEAYHALGCNEHEVFFMEISPSDGDAACQTWCNQFGVEYPTIGTAGGGGTICSNYQIPAYPTVILIAPDRSIVINDIWPISNAQTVINALAPFGIEEHECGVATNPAVEIAVGEVTSTTVEATFTPNDDCASYYLMISTAAEMEQWVNIMGLSLEELVKQWGIEETTEYTHTWTDMTPNTEYTVYALPLDTDGNYGELNTAIATTEQAGGTGVAVIALEVENVSNTEVITRATPNEETASYHYGLIEKTYFEEIGEEAAVELIRNDGYELYSYDEWTWIELVPNIYYYAISTGVNANGEWGETTMVEFYTSVDACAELIPDAFSIYPNPASTMINLQTELRGEAEISIIDMIGRCVKKLNVADINNATINIEGLEKGVYFFMIQTNNKYSVEKLIIK